MNARMLPRRTAEAVCSSRSLGGARPQNTPAGAKGISRALRIGRDALTAPGKPLDAASREFFEQRFAHDFSQVRVHTGTKAVEATRALNALAFTVGRDVVFGAGQYSPETSSGRRLLAHELAHVVQQRVPGSVPGEADMHRASGSQEVEADLIAQMVSHGESVRPITQFSGAALSMQEAQTSTPTSGATDRVIGALNRPDPIAGVGNPTEALSILRTLSPEDLVTTLVEVDNRFMLDLLVEAIGTGDQTEVGAVIYAVRFTSPHGTPETRYGVQAARGLAQLSEERQNSIIVRVLEARGSTATVAQIREGIEALLESESALEAQGEEEVDDLSASAVTVMAGVAMGPWNPGGMPIPFYIGNSAHVAIAVEYASFHGADAAFYNFSPISAILAAARALGVAVNPLALRAAQLGLKPDIANLTRRHLYEIKPANLQSLGATEARLYAAAFAAAGLPITLGPVGEPGTAGTIPAPGGWYTFSAPEPGVVTYRYRQPRRRRQRVRAPERSPAVDRTFVRRMQELTGLTGAALVIYIIISEGSRLFPPRNLIPVP